MSKSLIRIAYDGTAVKGQMDVQELAPALMAIGELLQQSNRVLNSDRTKVDVHVKSDFKTGSFEIILEITQSFADQIKFLLNNETSFTALQIVEFIGLSAATSGSLIGLIKWLKGRKINKITIENGNCKVETTEDYDVIVVSEDIINLYRDTGVRKSLKNTLKPLQQEGIDSFIVKEDGKAITEIKKNEGVYFEVPDLPDEKIIDTMSRVACKIIGVFFEEGLKWRLYDGENKINALIKDEDFLRALDKGAVAFTKGDILEIELRTIQWKTKDGLKKEHEVIKVLKHHKPHKQIPLPFERG